MPYFERTIAFAWNFAIWFRQTTPECYGYCADWLDTCVSTGNVLAWFDNNFSKKGTVTKVGKKFAGCGSMKPETKARVSSLYESYRYNPGGGSTWGRILRGTPYQVEDSVNIPISEALSNSLSSTISDYKYGMVGWSYDSDSGVDHRNHQTAVMCTEEMVHFFDPNIGLYIVDRNRFGDFFKKYYKDLIENEHQSLGRAGFYDKIDIRGVSLILT